MPRYTTVIVRDSLRSNNARVKLLPVLKQPFHMFGFSSLSDANTKSWRQSSSTHLPTRVHMSYLYSFLWKSTTFISPVLTTIWCIPETTLSAEKTLTSSISNTKRKWAKVVAASNLLNYIGHFLLYTCSPTDFYFILSLIHQIWKPQTDILPGWWVSYICMQRI